ncbi:hypothetical protein MesoLj113a_27640 [Mesorhizobium sp. 113-1-2]|nr:hypothetical protein MesoLj113a_27640 [Mesorhizobium sp. 113-1-2]
MGNLKRPCPTHARLRNVEGVTLDAKCRNQERRVGRLQKAAPYPAVYDQIYVPGHQPSIGDGRSRGITQQVKGSFPGARVTDVTRLCAGSSEQALDFPTIRL